MFPVGKDDDSFSSPSESPSITCDILSTVGPFEVSCMPVLPTNLSVTEDPPLSWGLTPLAGWFVVYISLICPRSISVCAISCAVGHSSPSSLRLRVPFSLAML